MDVRQLVILRELGDRGSVTAVAEALLVTPSAVSQQLAALQRAVPVALTRRRGRTLVLTEALIRVSMFLGAFAGMYFTVVLSTDDIYRNEFADDVGPEIRQALAVREAYRVERRTYPVPC